MVFCELEGKKIILKPLDIIHAEPLFYCSRNEKIWEKLPIHIKTLDEMKDFVLTAIEGRKAGDQFPYVVVDKATEHVIGTTRYLRISNIHNNLNIGWTWYTEEVWGTGVNTETKYLLLRQAFEQWNATRVEMITTTDHVRSQRAIEGLGAIKEGVLRKKYYNKDYVFYSIVDEQWITVKKRLESLLE